MSAPLCSAPWNSLYLDPHGNVKPCCVSFQKLGNVAKGASLTGAYASPELTHIRAEMLAGRFPDSCRICAKKEMVGAPSRRNVYDPVKLGPGERLTAEGDPRHVYMLDLSFTNVCNLRCRFCGPFCSSKWIEDSKKLPADDPMWAGHTGKDWKIFNVRAEEMMAQVDQFPNAHIFDINGGEPFLSTEHLRFLQMLVERGRAANTMMIYTTNGTVNNPEFLEVLRHFQDVKVAISSEGIGNTYRYSRGHDGAEAQLEKSLRFFGSLPNARLAINFTVGALNIFGISDFLRWFESMEKLFPLELTCDVVVAPWALQIQCLPRWFREEAVERLPPGDTPLLRQLRRMLIEEETPESRQMTPDAMLASFWKYVRTLDQLQKTSLTEMLPEYRRVEIPLTSPRELSPA